jgi:purine-binding chemotaxis protein CheW
MQIKEILIFKNSQENYGISTQHINQISRVPSLMNLPLRPYGTRGLCSVGGNILSMVDVNILLKMPQVDIKDQKSRLLSLNGKLSSNALLVSEVYNTVDIDEANIEYLDKSDDPIIAMYKYKDSLVQILSLENLISKISKVSIEPKKINSPKAKHVEVKIQNTTKFLIFAMSNERFALNIDYLQEIILADVSYSDIAKSSDDLLGIITLRDELISVVDLRSYYGFAKKTSDKNRILIVSLDSQTIGLLVDGIIDIKSYEDKNIEYMKECFEDNKISGVIHDANSLISFLDEEVLKMIFFQNNAHIDASSKSEQEDDFAIVHEAVIFKLLGKEYSFDIKYVSEIIDIVQVTKVAYCDDSIDGVINLRGQIITIVSLCEKLSIEKNVNENSKIIVCEIDNNKIGFVVDSISDIMQIRSNEFIAQDDELLTNVLHLNDGKRLVLSIDVQKVLKWEM